MREETSGPVSHVRREEDPALAYISWQASDTNTDQIVTLMNNSPGIAIRMNMVGNGGILSELDIFHSADFNRPSCIASNAAGEVTVSVFERVTATGADGNWSEECLVKV